MNNIKSFSIKEFNEKWLVFGLLGVYLLLAVIWHFSTDAPWDDDCTSRYFSAKDAINNPKNFISLWNRPLFILLFFIPFQISKHAILLMAVISAVNAYALYHVAKKLKIQNAFLIIPMLMFQAFFFTISRSALAEPLAATIISLGYLFYLNKKFLHFAIIGSLLPLARLEMSVLLIVWVYVLFTNKQWKYIILLGVPCVIWSLAGTLLDGGAFWLYEHTLGKENAENRYGHTDFWHYFLRYIFVIGPIVFYYFFIGLLERLYQRKFDIFLIGQFLLGFIMYVIFSWKLNLGQAAGFLRHLITLSPLATLLGLYGYNYWIQSVGLVRKSSPDSAPQKKDQKDETVLQNRIRDIQIQAKKKKLKQRNVRHLIVAEKKKFEAEKNRIVDKKRGEDTSFTKAKRTKRRIILYSILMIILAFSFFSKKLLGHHKLSDIDDYTNILVISALSVVFILLASIFRKRIISSVAKASVAFVLIASIMSYTLITEPPNSHNSPERKTMGSVSDLFLRGYLKNYGAYVNHSWFFWANDIDRDREVYKLITKENLEQAPDSSIIIWENHYSRRLQGDVELKYFQNKPEYLELFREMSSDRTFLLVVFQKIKPNVPQEILKIYDRFIASEPNIPSAYINRANIKFNKLRKFDQAMVDYDKAIELDSTYIDAHFNKGLAYFNLRKFKEAIGSFAKAAELKPDYYQAHYNVGVGLSNTGDYANAILKFDKVIELKSDYDQAYFNRAIAHTNLNEFDKAIADYTKVINLKHQNIVQAYYNRATIYMQKGETKNGCIDFQKAQELGHPNAKNMIKQYCRPANKKAL